MNYFASLLKTTLFSFVLIITSCSSGDSFEPSMDAGSLQLVMGNVEDGKAVLINNSADIGELTVTPNGAIMTISNPGRLSSRLHRSGNLGMEWEDLTAKIYEMYPKSGNQVLILDVENWEECIYLTISVEKMGGGRKLLKSCNYGNSWEEIDFTATSKPFFPHAWLWIEKSLDNQLYVKARSTANKYAIWRYIHETSEWKVVTSPENAPSLLPDISYSLGINDRLFAKTSIQGNNPGIYYFGKNQQWKNVTSNENYIVGTPSKVQNSSFGSSNISMIVGSERRMFSLCHPVRTYRGGSFFEAAVETTPNDVYLLESTDSGDSWRFKSKFNKDELLFIYDVWDDHKVMASFRAPGSNDLGNLILQIVDLKTGATRDLGLSGIGITSYVRQKDHHFVGTSKGLYLVKLK
jgi:hypothetical protein